MIVLLDRGLSGNDFPGVIAGTGAASLARLSAARKPPVLRRFPDGSFLSRLGTLPVRIIECKITIATTAGRHTGVYRLAQPCPAPATIPRSSWSSSTTSAGCATRRCVTEWG